MTVFALSTGALTLARLSGQSTAQTIAFAKSLKLAYPKTIEACKAQPEGRFLDAFKQAIKDSGG